MRHEFTIGPPDEGRRLDRFVQQQLGRVPMSLVQRLIRKGQVRVDGRRTNQAGNRLRVGQSVVIHHTPPEPSALEPRPNKAELEYEGPSIPILHRDPSFLAVNKPARVACSEDESTRANLPAWARGVLAEEMAAGRVRPSLCHRLDRDTTGVVVFGLTAAAVTAFHRALAAGTVDKRYWVAVWGQPEARFAIRTRLRKRPQVERHEPKVVAAGEGEAGLEAHTRLRVLARGRTATLLEAVPVTGRTHQIRAHLRIQGWPVVGDRRYGDPERDRALGISRLLDHQLLHARSLHLPGDDPERSESGRTGLRIHAEPPREVTGALKHLGLTPSLDGEPDI